MNVTQDVVETIKHVEQAIFNRILETIPHQIRNVQLVVLMTTEGVADDEQELKSVWENRLKRLHIANKPFNPFNFDPPIRYIVVATKIIKYADSGVAHKTELLSPSNY